jgi:glycolate oxidase
VNVGVPLPALADLVSLVAKIAEQHGLIRVSSARPTDDLGDRARRDGNTNPLIVFDPTDNDEAERAQLAFGDIMDLAVGPEIAGQPRLFESANAVLAGDRAAETEAMELNRRIKQASDPANILNPGAAI